MRWLHIESFALVACLASLLGCSTARPDCGCLVERGAERRSLACGQSACVAGRLEICTETAEIIENGACTAAPPSNAEPDAGSSGTGPTTPPSNACQDLGTYCSTSCNSPATTAADCQATASAGDENACEQWPLANGVLCHP